MKDTILAIQDADVQEPAPLRNDKFPSLADLVSNPYITASTSDNTRKAYRSDMKHFERGGGRLPATPEVVIAYLQKYAETLNPRTLARRLTAIKNWHIYQSFSDPTIHPAISKTLAGISRVHGRPKEKAYPLLPEDLLRIVMHLQAEDSLSSIRDNALLQMGFFGAFRRSELIAIEYEHIKWEKEGIEILIPKSKTDQLHEGQFCAIPYGRDLLCPVTVLSKWLEEANINSGPVFRRILVSKQLGNDCLTPLAVNQILKRRAEECKISYANQLSSHSLRRGLASSASRSGAGIPVIMRHGRWKQVNTVMEYIEASERFSENAVSSVLERFYAEK
jgi:integrase